MNKVETLKTPYRKKMDERNAKIYAEWKELSANPDSNITIIQQKIAQRYKLKSRGSVWRVIKMMEKKES